jgi:hypothetical protein
MDGEFLEQRSRVFNAPTSPEHLSRKNALKSIVHKEEYLMHDFRRMVKPGYVPLASE